HLQNIGKGKKMDEWIPHHLPDNHGMLRWLDLNEPPRHFLKPKVHPEMNAICLFIELGLGNTGHVINPEDPSGDLAKDDVTKSGVFFLTVNSANGNEKVKKRTQLSGKEERTALQGISSEEANITQMSRRGPQKSLDISTHDQPNAKKAHRGFLVPTNFRDVVLEGRRLTIVLTNYFEASLSLEKGDTIMRAFGMTLNSSLEGTHILYFDECW
ncbi:hypothetical protein WH47_07469, partial [Habropoda laboriosa]